MQKRRLIAVLFVALLMPFSALDVEAASPSSAVAGRALQTGKGRKPTTSRRARRASTAPARSNRRRTKSAASRRHRRGRTARKATRPGSMIPSSRVLEIQHALISRGHLQEPATGQYDQATIAAMRAFQTHESIDATGYPTAHSLKRLGLSDGPAGSVEATGPGSSP
ncbi:MAG: peptidoglycan-binding protein [Acidobacteria bacterium]|nr:peptidoglycan-binding protein [Acidobacteriota bacterium]